jgi:hypothetical protein
LSTETADYEDIKETTSKKARIVLLGFSFYSITNNKDTSSISIQPSARDCYESEGDTQTSIEILRLANYNCPNTLLRQICTIKISKELGLLE